MSNALRSETAHITDEVTKEPSHSFRHIGISYNYVGVDSN